MGETSIVALGGHLIWSQGDGGVIYKTTDGGESWIKIWDGGTPSALARYMWINPANPDVIYVSTGIFDRGTVNESTDYNTDIDPWGGLGILKSTDGGQTWRILGKDNGLEGLYVGSLYMHPQNPDILLAAIGHEMGFAQINHLLEEGNSPAGIYRTNDGGETWTHVVEPPADRPNEEFSAVEFCTSDPKNIAYAGSAAAIYRSTDAGVTWTQMTPSDVWGPPDSALAGRLTCNAIRVTRTGCSPTTTRAARFSARTAGPPGLTPARAIPAHRSLPSSSIRTT